ncbi:MAG: hypothetical protein ACK501_06955 [Planctomycetota bacterium]|jgi:hypothetical protein
MRRTLGSLLLPLLLGFALAASATAQEPSRARQLLERSGCQTSLPGEHEGAGGGAGGNSGKRRRTGRDENDSFFSLGKGGAAIAEVLLWTVVGGATVLLVVAIVRGLAERSRPVVVRTTVVAAPSAPKAEPAPAEQPLPDHERFAAAGDFAGALHAVLQRAIVRFVERGGRLPKHCTARGALSRIDDAALPRDAFGHLVAATEVVRYAGRSAERTDYDAACAQLQRWEDACRQRP